MSSLRFVSAELASAVGRGVSQCVLIASRPPVRQFVKSCFDPELLFAVQPPVGIETLSAALQNSVFDRMKTSLFVWLGAAPYRTADAVLAGLSFIASLPKGSGVIFDYAVERAWSGSATETALDAMASRIVVAGHVKSLIQPEAVAAMLRGLGFRQIVDLPEEDAPVSGGRLVSAVV